jgi:hypothetical protein
MPQILSPGGILRETIIIARTTENRTVRQALRMEMTPEVRELEVRTNFSHTMVRASSVRGHQTLPPKSLCAPPENNITRPPVRACPVRAPVNQFACQTSKRQMLFIVCCGIRTQ